MVQLPVNYGQKSECKLCDKKELDSQEHLIVCEKIQENLKSFKENEVKHDDIYSENAKKMQNVAEVFKKCLKTREILLEAKRRKN